MSSQTKPLTTPKRYLEIERKAEVRSEYLAGEVFAMSGASRRHNRIVTNLVSQLDQQLRDRPCNVYSSDLRVKTNSGVYTYPDVVVTCGEEIFEDDELDTLLNPLLIIEVLSKSTEAYDRGAKFAHYQQIDYLSEYCLVAQDQWSVERYVRQSDQTWLYSNTTSSGNSVTFSSLGCQLQLADIYFKLPPVESGAAAEPGT